MQLRPILLLVSFSQHGYTLNSLYQYKNKASKSQFNLPNTQGNQVATIFSLYVLSVAFTFHFLHVQLNSWKSLFTYKANGVIYFLFQSAYQHNQHKYIYIYTQNSPWMIENKLAESTFLLAVTLKNYQKLCASNFSLKFLGLQD
jgi:Cdc6-like AAA superfamily ATPase